MNYKNKLTRYIYSKLKAVLTITSPILASKVMYRVSMKKKLNLKKPKTFNEKLQWLKLYNNTDLIWKCTDKFEVRKYVEECGCKNILNDLYFVTKDIENIDWNKLPNKFVLKCTNGAGSNIICPDKEKLNLKESTKEMKKWLNKKYYLVAAEMQYKKINSKIICEKYLESSDGLVPNDYKVFCFNGKPEFIMVCTERDTGHAKYNYFTKDWKLLRYSPRCLELPRDFSIEKPKGIDEMFLYAEKLSKPFPFVRVDFYSIDGKIIFGELTFTPAGGLDYDLLDEVQVDLGKRITLPI